MKPTFGLFPRPTTDFKRHRALFIGVERLLLLSYVRVTDLYTCCPWTISRQRKPRYQDEALTIGYAVVGKEHGIPVYNTKYFWLKSYDRDFQPEGVYRLPDAVRDRPECSAMYGPCEAVPPETVLTYFQTAYKGEAQR